MSATKTAEEQTSAKTPFTTFRKAMIQRHEHPYTPAEPGAPQRKCLDAMLGPSPHGEIATPMTRNYEKMLLLVNDGKYAKKNTDEKNASVKTVY